MNVLTRVFLKTDMRCQHFGLKKLAKQYKCNLDTLKTNEHVMFVNSSLTRVKLYSYNGILSYLRLDKRTPFDLKLVREFADTFNETGDAEFSYSVALKNRIEKQLKNK